jgi:PAS domain S-box-containing protein
MIGRRAQRFATAIDRPVARYAAALAAVAAAAALHGLMMDPPANFMAFYPAVLFATLVAGLRGGAFATGASALAVWLFWSPKDTPQELWRTQHIQLVLFVLTALATVAIAKALRLAIQRGAAAEEQFRTFQDQSLDAFVMVEPVREGAEIVDFAWTYANPAARRMMPPQPGGRASRRLRDAFPGPTGVDMVARLKAGLQTSRPDEIVASRVINGEARWMRSTVVRIGDGMAITFRDVTDQHLADSAMREAEALARRGRDQFRHIANAAPVLIWMSGPDQRGSWFNDSWLNFTGRTLEQEEGRGWLEGVHPDDREPLLATYADHFARREAGRVEYRLRRADGQYRWLDEAAAPSFDSEGNFAGYVGSCVDITDRRAAEAALRTGSAQVRALLDSLPQLLWSSRADGHCDYFSPQWVTYTGVPPQDHRGEGWLDAIHPEERDDVRRAWDQAVRGGLPFDTEYRIRRHDGVWRWFSSRASAVREDDGSVRRWFGTSSDITEIVEARRDLEERVAERTLALEQSLEERARAEAALAQAQRLETVGRLTGGVAHDFNNLLTVVIGGLDMILKRPADSARVTRLAEAALAAGQRGERLTRQLLAFSRRQELKPEIVDMSALIAQAEPLVRRAVGQAVDLVVTSDPDLGACRLDAAQFEAALLNLVVNASDAVGETGRIEIRARRRSLAAGEVPDAGAGDHVAVSVSDSGPGMPDEVMQRAFEPFFTTKEVGKGTGLGLAQVYGFIRQAGGVVTIESPPGEGVTVTLFAPAVEGVAVVDPPAPASNETPWTRGVRILLVEDDAAVRAVTESLLDELGCRVVVEPDGAAAFRRLETGEAFDLLLTDIVMPGGMNGVELARLARARDPALPIVLTTGYAGDRFGDEAVDWPVLRKPFRAEQLATIMREVLAEMSQSAA